jgi:asparagine synthetase B (glutamine-hydrolysing)
MCGILVSTKNISDQPSHLLINRGPDNLKIENKENINFLHTLLSMTGEFTEQPIVKNNIVFLLNGEIYNYKKLKNYSSDLYYVIDLYLKHDENFVKYLDGEYAIVIADFNKKMIYMCTDIFGIKPLYYSIQKDNFGIASYKEPLEELNFNNIKKIEPSTILKLNLTTQKIEFNKKYFEFDLRPIGKNFNSWTESFIDAIDKRFKQTDKEIILPISSGFDSGAIACAFKLLDIRSTYYSFTKNEHQRVLNKRIKKITNANNIYLKESLSDEEIENARNLILEKCSTFNYGPDLNEADMVFKGIEDRGAMGLAHLLNEVKNKNNKIKILASGQGADEIMSNIQAYNFGKPNPISFQEDLSKIFPWQNFYLGTQSSYLAREESITGGFGIEGRYPFLDKAVVQEFLWLDSSLKNKTFKSPIVNFLKKYNFPYRRNRNLLGQKVSVKSGFNA